MKEALSDEPRGLGGMKIAGPAWLSAEGRKEWTKLRARFPDAYRVPGVGWCGPGHEELARAERELFDRHEDGVGLGGKPGHTQR